MFNDLNPMDKSTAMLEIAIMVIGAALLGFLVAWIIRKLQHDRIRADLRFMESKQQSLQTKSDLDERNILELQRQVEDLRKRKDSLYEELEQLKEGQSDIRPELNGLHQKIDTLEAERDALKKEVEDLKSKDDGTSREDRDDLENEINDLKQELDDTKAQLADAGTSEDSALEEQHRELREAHESLKEELEKTKSANRNLEDTMEQMEAGVTAASGSDNALKEEIERLKATLIDSNEVKAQLKTKLSSLTESLPDPGELDRLQDKLDKLDTENISLRERISRMEHNSEADKIRRLNQEIQSLRNDNKGFQEEIQDLEDKLEDVSATPADPKELADLKLQVAALDSEKLSLQNALRKHIAEQELHHESPNGHVEESPADEDDTEQEDTSIESPEEEVVEEQAEEQSEFSPADVDQVDVAAPIKAADQDVPLTYEEYQAKKKALLASVGKSSEGQKDSLTKIEGVGPFIEAKLNSIGIYSFDQLARLDDEQVHSVTRLISFLPGRIKSNDWVGQAQKLAAQKQNA